MDRVGGYLGYVALMANDRAFDDVCIALAGESDAHRILKMQADK